PRGCPSFAPSPSFAAGVCPLSTRAAGGGGGDSAAGGARSEREQAGRERATTAAPTSASREPLTDIPCHLLTVQAPLPGPPVRARPGAAGIVSAPPPADS